MAFGIPQEYFNQDPASVSGAAFMMESEMGWLVSSIASDPFVLTESLLVGVSVGDDDLRFTLIDTATSAYELLEAPANKQAAVKYDFIALVASGWVEARDGNEDGSADGNEDGASGDIIGRERVRMTVFSGKNNTCTVLRFTDKDALFDEGAGGGPIADALAAFWQD